MSTRKTVTTRTGRSASSRQSATDSPGPDVPASSIGEDSDQEAAAERKLQEQLEELRRKKEERGEGGG
jgi:hypothetical protein